MLEIPKLVMFFSPDPLKIAIEQVKKWILPKKLCGFGYRVIIIGLHGIENSHRVFRRRHVTVKNILEIYWESVTAHPEQSNI